MRRIIAVVGVLAFVAIVALASRTVPATVASAAAGAAAPYATADPADASLVAPKSAFGRDAIEDRVDRHHVVHGLVIPIEGAELPTDAELLPNASRDYRGGTHEGIDVAAPLGTPVRAVAAGTVVRIDHDFTDWEEDAREAALAEAVTLGHTPAATLDRIRGRQVWIDHGHGILSRYAHLSAVADALSVGDPVELGQVIGAVGASGYPEGGPHLHLEIRVANRFLGEGLAGDALREAIGAAFR
jgi:murein DD-endopeptidase MepM/ murein hydrolase activator NlpD